MIYNLLFLFSRYLDLPFVCILFAFIFNKINFKQFLLLIFLPVAVLSILLGLFSLLLYNQYLVLLAIASISIIVSVYFLHKFYKNRNEEGIARVIFSLFLIISNCGVGFLIINSKFIK